MYFMHTFQSKNLQTTENSPDRNTKTPILLILSSPLFSRIYTMLCHIFTNVVRLDVVELNSVKWQDS